MLLGAGGGGMFLGDGNASVEYHRLQGNTCVNLGDGNH